jgi:magnesium transporter
VGADGLGLYRGGLRVATPPNLPTLFAARRFNPDTLAWVGLANPAPEDVAALGREFGLHELVVEDAITAHQRPKVERYGETLFVVLHAARYLDAAEDVEFAEVHICLGADFVITLLHGTAPDLGAVRARFDGEPDLVAAGPHALLYTVLDLVVDGYGPVITGLENDIDEIETEVFSGDPAVSRRIYQLSREVIEFRRATRPLDVILQRLQGEVPRGADGAELRRHLRDVADHNIQVSERIDGFGQLLRDMLTVNATLVAQKQNEEMKALSEASHAQGDEVKKISAWGAILFAPTLIGTVYGMNFQHMPGQDTPYGFALAMALMTATCGLLYVAFKRRDWL